jgi:hypothetical protein
MFQMPFAPIISTTAVYSHMVFYGFGMFYSIEQVLVLGHFDTLAQSVTDFSRTK